jgi:4-diphosphocytidyl-2C-methyl-D-erythritol kinase
MIDRKATATALAKVIAYKNCGKDEDAYHWLKILLRELGVRDLDKIEIVGYNKE